MDTILIGKVAARTMYWSFHLWRFGEAVALRGLLGAVPATGDSEPLGYALALLRAYLARGVARSPEEHVAPARELLIAFELTGEERFLAAAGKLAALHASFPLNRQGARLHRADMPGWSRQIWVDCMDLDAPFLAHLARITGIGEYADRAAGEICAYSRLLQDPETGLFHHGFEECCGVNGQLWARGNGWALMGLVETLDLLPADHPQRNELLSRLRQLCEGLARRQDESGLWRTVIPEQATYLESTLAAMVAYSLRLGFARGLLDEAAFGPTERQAREAVMRLIREDGSLDLVSDATPAAEAAMYASRPFGTFPWGQGPLLLMLTQS